MELTREERKKVKAHIGEMPTGEPITDAEPENLDRVSPAAFYNKLEFSDRFVLAVYASWHGLAEPPYDTKIPDAKWYTCTMWQKIVL